MIVLGINTVNRLVAWVCDLLGVLGNLDLRAELTSLGILNGSQLVNAAEGRPICGSNHLCTNAPGMNLAALTLQALDDEFVQIVGGRNHCIGKSGFVQHLASLLR